MGSSLYKSLYPKEQPNVALLNIGSEELKVMKLLKKHFTKLNEKKSMNLIFLVILKVIN